MGGEWGVDEAGDSAEFDFAVGEGEDGGDEQPEACDEGGDGRHGIL